MSLFKQISLLVSLAFLLLFALVSFDNSQQSSLFLRGQLQTSAQDTATVLGIAISTTGSGNDIAALDTLFNAVFDSGYYSEIRFQAADGRIIHQKKRALTVQDVPDWFIHITPLNTATGAADVMQGWSPLGRLELTLHPGFAYTNLYQGLKTTLLWFSILFFLVLVLLWYVLHIVLKPLKATYKQANAIQKNEFIQQTIIPKTTELRRVVEAMNRLTAKVQKTFEDQQETLVRYQNLLYRDELTGLRNRRFMLSELDGAILESAAYNGCMVMIKIQGLEPLREQQGYGKTDDVIKALAETIDKQLKNKVQNKYARMSDEEFSLLLKVDHSIAENVTADIFKQFERYCIDQSLGSSVFLIAGITDVYSGCSHGKVLAEIDLALTQAQSAGNYQQRYAVSTDLVLPEGKMQWHSWFQKTLVDELFYLVAQPVMGCDKKCLHKEIFVRVNDSQGELIPAGIFMPMAMALGYSLEIDRRVFSLLKKINNNMGNTPLAFNLSTEFFCHADGLDEFKQLLTYYEKQEGVLCVEASHSALQQYPDRCAEVLAAVKHAGQVFGVDQLDVNASMQILQTIRPDYVKINAKVLDDLSSNEVSAAYQALRSLTSALDIQLIAVGVDKPDLHQRLLALHIDALQGNLLGQPERVI